MIFHSKVLVYQRVSIGFMMIIVYYSYPLGNKPTNISFGGTLYISKLLGTCLEQLGAMGTVGTVPIIPMKWRAKELRVFNHQ